MIKEDSIEFVSYTGEYPCLCSGLLTVKINDKEYRFGSYESVDPEWHFVFELPRFWMSDGGAGVDEDGEEFCYGSGWIQSVDENDSDWNEYPDEVKRNIPRLLKLFNENVATPCCGGCI